MNANLSRRVVAEAVGTAMLLAAVVGSGIMADRLSGGNQAIALLANTIATGAALVAVILTFGSISGAHLNPAVTLAVASQGGLAWRDVPGYLIAQCGGAVLGVWVAHAMFEQRVLMLSRQARSGSAQLFSEFIATFGLVAVIWGCSRRRAPAVPFAVAAYVTAAYWFTASTSFANPAVTVARADRHICRHSTWRRPGLCARAMRRLDHGHAPVSMAHSRVARNGTRCDAARGIHTTMTTVLFACVQNAGRSQMAAAWFTALADPSKARAISAGTNPGPGVHSNVIAAMREVGVDLAGAPTTRLTADVAQQAHWLVTMGCGDQCPYVPGATRDDWLLEDPKDKPIERVREIRDEIRNRVHALIAQEGWSRPGVFS